MGTTMIINYGNNIALELRGKLGNAEGIGRHALGKTENGFFTGLTGTFQIRRTKKSGRIQVLSADTTSGNPRTVKQQANRNRFKDAMTEWQGLSDEQKTNWKNKAHGKKQNGMNLFVKHRMLDN